MWREVYERSQWRLPKKPEVIPFCCQQTGVSHWPSVPEIHVNIIFIQFNAANVTAYHWYQKQMRRASIILIYFCGTVERQTDSRTSPLHITYYWVSCKYQHQNDMKISSGNCARVNSWIHGQLKSHSDPESLKLLTRKCNCNSRVMRTSCVDVAQLLTEYLSTD